MQSWRESKLKGKTWIFRFLLRQQLGIADINHDLLSRQGSVWFQNSHLCRRQDGYCLLLSQRIHLQLQHLIRRMCVTARREPRPHLLKRDLRSSWEPMDIGTGLGIFENGCGIKRAIITSRIRTQQISFHRTERWMIGWVGVGLTGHAALATDLIRFSASVYKDLELRMICMYLS